jgi:hypothetical protein
MASLLRASVFFFFQGPGKSPLLKDAMSSDMDYSKSAAWQLGAWLPAIAHSSWPGTLNSPSLASYQPYQTQLAKPDTTLHIL